MDLSELVSTIERHRVAFASIVAGTIALGLLYAGTRAPVYKTSATLKLEQDTGGSSVLSDLAALTSAPAAEGEMSILRSRAMVEATVAASDAPSTSNTRIFTPTDPDNFRMDDMRRLDLTTRVECEDRRPFNDLWRATGWMRAREQRLFASLRAVAPDAPLVVRVRFPSATRVTLSVPAHGGWFDRDERDFDYTPGSEIEYSGARIRLQGVGDFVGSSYLVERRSFAETVDAWLSQIEVEETSRNSGVIRLTVRDSDPDRAAEFANALCHNFLLRSIRLGRSRAARTIDFVDEQLEGQQRELDRAEREVVDVQKANPAVILPSASAESLIKQLAEQETERTRAQFARTLLVEAADALDRGEPDALARLSRELPDLVSLSYIEAIGRLGGESLALERSDVGPTKALLQSKLDQLALEDHEAEVREKALVAGIDALRAGDASALARLFAEAPTLSALDPTTSQLLAETARVDAEISALRGDVTPANPRWSQLHVARTDLEQKIAQRLQSAAEGLRLAACDRAELTSSFREALDAWPVEERARIESAVGQLATRVSGNLRARIASLTSEEHALDERIQSLESELAALPELERTVAEPLRRRETHAQVVKLLLESRQQAQLSAAATLPSAILIDPALPPDGRHAPRLFFYFVLSCAAGLGLGLLAALVRQSLSGAVHSQAEVEEATGLSVFGSIPDFRRGRLRIRRAGPRFLALRDDPDGPIAEAYRSVRENLRFARDDERALRTLALTSCVPAEGKTTTNINLAMAYAAAGRRVLLVDADMRKPNVHACFDAPLSPGLGDVLRDKAPWRDCVRPSGVENLELLCAGKVAGSPGELLGSERFKRELGEWREAYDLVVFDLPPALSVADAEVVAHELDGVVLLYKSGGVHRDALATAARKLTRSGAQVLGVVINALQPTRAGSSSYYGGYGYGYGRDERPRKAG